ncbi:MAG: circularly permuted type 2 ATP-grasp protein [Myxococcota bacterium]|nr:circularly permuted type 2 ATP-grasp protein [Myxococcota bacterium]
MNAQPANSEAVDPFVGYRPLPKTYDEVFDTEGRVHPSVSPVFERLRGIGRAEYRRLQRLADDAFLRGGVTFSVYGEDGGNPDRIFPFDLMPRVVTRAEWEQVESGLIQRIAALNLFLGDVYGEQRILKEGIVPREMVESSRAFMPSLMGVRPPGGIYVHIAGIDLIRDTDGRFLVLEDNIRTPSGVSYVLENRMVMRRVMPELANARVAPVDDYPRKLREALASVAPCGGRDGHAVVLTPGPFNSAYFEHSFLARRMGCELVRGSDLFVERDRVYACTTRGPQRVDVIYRRIDDEFLDPESLRSDSALGVPGLMRAYAAGEVALVNAVGNGVADDKGIYPYVPDMVRFYLDQEPILPQVPTYVCQRDEDLRYVLDHLDELVIKAVGEAGGYGMLVGPRACREEIETFRERLAADPRNYIAQPLVQLSSCPTWTDQGLAPRRVDLRPYVITGEESWVLPGGLTRVALVEGSYVVNSSQGGGSKDTWILEEEA